MSDCEEVIASSHATGTSEGTKSSSVGTEEPLLMLKNKRKQLRGKVTHTINRVRKFITDQDQTKRRIEKELELCERILNWPVMCTPSFTVM